MGTSTIFVRVQAVDGGIDKIRTDRDALCSELFKEDSFIRAFKREGPLGGFSSGLGGPELDAHRVGVRERVRGLRLGDVRAGRGETRALGCLVGALASGVRLAARLERRDPSRGDAREEEASGDELGDHGVTLLCSAAGAGAGMYLTSGARVAAMIPAIPAPIAAIVGTQIPRI